MDSAIHTPTGELVPIKKGIPTAGPYECPDCHVPVFPAATTPSRDYKMPPYFHASGKRPHTRDCRWSGEPKLVGPTEATGAGGPGRSRGRVGRLPQALALRDSHEQTDPAGSPPRPRSPRPQDIPPASGDGERPLVVRTIGPLCTVFLRDPSARTAPLSVDGVTGRTYAEVFRLLPNGIRHHATRHIFYAPIAWRQPSVDSLPYVITLDRGDWQDGKPGRRYRIRLELPKRLPALEKHILRVWSRSMTEGKTPRPPGAKPERQGWVFFLGRQDDTDESRFLVTGHACFHCRFGAAPPRPPAAPTSG